MVGVFDGKAGSMSMTQEQRRARQREFMARLRFSRTPHVIAKRAAEIKREAMLAFAYESDLRYGTRIMHASECRAKAIEAEA